MDRIETIKTHFEAEAEEFERQIYMAFSHDYIIEASFRGYLG